MKLEPDYKSDDSILDEDSDYDSLELVDSNTHGKRKPGKGTSKDKSQEEIEEEKRKSKNGKTCRI